MAALDLLLLVLSFINSFNSSVISNSVEKLFLDSDDKPDRGLQLLAIKPKETINNLRHSHDYLKMHP